MRFVGVDLGWKMDPPRSGGTGICQLDRDGKVELAKVVTDDAEIVDIIDRAGDCWVGIDASLSVMNEYGLRPCERRLRDMGIRVLPTNINFLRDKFGGSRGEALVHQLSELGFKVADGKDHDTRSLFEVFPHGTLHLLSGGHRPDYKKGAGPSRSEARRVVIAMVQSWEPSIEVPDVLQEEGVKDKVLEDILDAWICVACTYSHWLNGGRTTLMVGEEGDGHILLGCYRHE